MIYEARHGRSIHFGLAIACAMLSVLGFAAAGVIPTGSGSNPQVGWAIVAACFAAAALFVRRALDRTPQARADAGGIWSRRLGEAVPWGEIERVYLIRAGIQRIARFARRGGREFGINTTFYDRGVDDLFAVVRQYRPDLAP